MKFTSENAVNKNLESVMNKRLAGAESALLMMYPAPSRLRIQGGL